MDLYEGHIKIVTSTLRKISCSFFFFLFQFASAHVFFDMEMTNFMFHKAGLHGGF